METTTALPRWDMTVVYPGVDSPEFAAALEGLLADLAALEALFDGHGVRRDGAPADLDAAAVASFEEVTEHLNRVEATRHTIEAYLQAFVTTDTRDSLAQARLSELQQRGVRLSQLRTRYQAWVGGFDLGALAARSAIAREHTFPLAMATVAAAHQMSPAEEDLAAALDPSGAGAWEKLHGDLTSQLSVPLEVRPGEGIQDLPMSAVRNLGYDPDREVRRRAYEAELGAWERAALPLAAAMNGIKGQVGTLAARRGWADPLDEALHRNRIDRATLDAMLGAAEEAFPDLRRYLRAKARALGVPVLAWYDLFAPVAARGAGGADGAGPSWSYEAGTALVREQFGAYSPRLRDFADRAFRERWVDAGPRPGKVGGAFCMALRGEESRILSNYHPGYGGVATLAHELGHAYHNLNLAGLTPLQRQTPMTLAETASTFCETIVRDAALRDADPAAGLVILEASLQGTCQTIVDITSRFRFESAVFAGRRERELSIDELRDLMLDAQRGTYGDGLDGAALHPYMWAVKPHYYATASFYNYPYLFGLLFGLGLYAEFGRDPEGFRGRYDDLLASTGRADAATLAARFGIDLRSPDFWRSSLDLIRADIDRFEALVAAAVA
ncbi:MAG: Oligoendopeptidase F [uncultured Thermomicrobiales bacterium]|uniref:Oligoendopeptidase F n=1 Tax=uncultured Thermomicrobiales bacterium TaxID=1645740 RepID=A0A6J4VFN5_9BACT|nr:MAG: Oligoendopeptidase F [uncultured Thermomicrobiales bacterium]